MSMLLRRYHEKPEHAGADVPENEAQEAEDGAPAGNASKAEWHDYAISQGYTEEGLEGRTRDEIRDLFND